MVSCSRGRRAVGVHLPVGGGCAPPQQLGDVRLAIAPGLRGRREVKRLRISGRSSGLHRRAAFSSNRAASLAHQCVVNRSVRSRHCSCASLLFRPLRRQSQPRWRSSIPGRRGHWPLRAAPASVGLSLPASTSGVAPRPAGGRRGGGQGQVEAAWDAFQAVVTSSRAHGCVFPVRKTIGAETRTRTQRARLCMAR